MNKVYCQDCKFSFVNRINPNTLCNCPLYKYLEERSGNYFNKPKSWMACKPCEDLNKNNNCVGYKRESLISRIFGFGGGGSFTMIKP
jgi:hypothetical protein